MRATPRYEGFADWYDETFSHYAVEELSSASHLRRLLGPGEGRCLDIGCGTGFNFEAVTSTGHRVVGVDVSGDQLRLARRRPGVLVQSDAVALPFADATFDAVTATYLHTDVDDIAPVFREAYRVLRPDGRLVYIGVHPCFGGHFVELLDERTKVIHPGYRDARWHERSPSFLEGGVGIRLGYRHVPLAELIGAVIDAGLRLAMIEEPQEVRLPGAVTPGMLALVATKD
jgi:SAM-dependent methyltransferase